MFDDEFQELSQHDMDHPQGPFLWHRFLSDSSAPLGSAYRAFLSACTSGPIVANAPGACLLEGAVGSSEWAEEDQASEAKVDKTKIDHGPTKVAQLAAEIGRRQQRFGPQTLSKKDKEAYVEAREADLKQQSIRASERASG